MAATPHQSTAAFAVAPPQAAGGAGRSRALVRVRALLLSPPGLVALMSAAFVLGTACWLAVDNRIPDFDSGKHLMNIFWFHDRLGQGHLLAPLQDYRQYAPLPYLVGAAGEALAGPSVGAAVLALNVVFVPLLAFGCYGAASI